MRSTPLKPVQVDEAKPKDKEMDAGRAQELAAVKPAAPDLGWAGKELKKWMEREKARTRPEEVWNGGLGQEERLGSGTGQ